MQQLAQDVAAHLQGSSVAKVEIYDLEGRTVFATDPSQIGTDKRNSSGFLAARSGQTVSRLGHRDVFKAWQSTLRHRDLLSSYLPIRRAAPDASLSASKFPANSGTEQGDIVAVFEVYSDVTPLLLHIHQTQRYITLGSLAILAVLYGILVTFVRKADRLLTRQYQEVQTSESRYRAQSQELESTLDELKRAQTQMLHSEKMSSLGQMVAGVAHEVNNPVNFIHGNLQHLSGYTHDLLNFLQLYEQHYPNPADEIQQKAEALEIDFIREDLERTLASMEAGTERIRKIVLALRNFARLDESEAKAVDIHQGIESALMLLEHRLKAQESRGAIKVVCNYDRQLPPVECYAGQLNQVLLNILNNAIDALDHQGNRQQASEQPQITISTQSQANTASITIADNGPGIPSGIQSRIFDPFFTTKEVGQGMGMGLAISHQLITEQHHGQLECISQEGRGTEFCLKIPLQLMGLGETTKQTKSDQHRGFKPELR